MELLGDVGHVESHSVRLEMVSVCKVGAWFALNVPKAQISFWTHPMELLGDVGHVESRSVRLEMVLVLVQDRCTVCAERTIGSDIVLDAPDGTPR